MFQSTPPRRGDLRLALGIGLGFGVSIHAPAKGRPPVAFLRRPRIGVSIHAPAKGRRCDAQIELSVAGRVSIHAPAKGRREPGVAGTGREFQSTPPRRGDWRTRSSSSRDFEFQSTPPRRGDAAIPTGCWAAVARHFPRTVESRQVASPLKVQTPPASVAGKGFTVIANPPAFPCELGVRVRRSAGHRCRRPVSHRDVPPGETDRRLGSRTEHCRRLGR